MLRPVWKGKRGEKGLLVLLNPFLCFVWYFPVTYIDFISYIFFNS